MNRDYTKDYIELSKEFRKSDASTESIEKLYDLLYELENANRTKQDDLVRSNTYALLGFHKSAYEVFKTVADLTNRKEATKMYVMEEKAKSHKDNFIIKDIRKYREKKEQPKLELSDFVASKKTKNKFKIANKNIVIFNKLTEKEKVSVYLPNEHIEGYLDKIIDYINWLSNCKTELIDFYNNECNEDTANENWYDTLEVYSTRIIIEDSRDIFCSISGGDDFYQDHLLDIEITNSTITSMIYNG
ncbi:hypothetical protein OIU80_13875 [Flavobacterium sp. LS1R47]|uniref:Uncharacterized protein n=1 Tax=Flavobacterium frigoritolerans TaxID=2987686 RepID=A0A9X2ZPQ3_9FLAO|nr:hypothetical protein [Flavobacterium frigoritolerans]MCV9933375.1 hypothetical protein [Flavobacterium frigoritolerans]